jgi:hypothetical protein
VSLNLKYYWFYTKILPLWVAQRGLKQADGPLAVDAVDPREGALGGFGQGPDQGGDVLGELGADSTDAGA